jgi:hypothetical protein
LVEVLVSITLLLMVIVGPLQIISHTNNSTAYATEQMTAWLLAQEGLELAQQARDGYMLNYFNHIDEGSASPYKNAWTLFKTDPLYAKCFTATGCDMVIKNSGVFSATDIADCSTIANCLLYRNTSTSDTTGRASYQHVVNTTPSPFTRVVTMTATGNQEILVTSTVMWRTGSLIATQQVVTSTTLFNIYDTPP